MAGIFTSSSLLPVAATCEGGRSCLSHFVRPCILPVSGTFGHQEAAGETILPLREISTSHVHVLLGAVVREVHGGPHLG